MVSETDALREIAVKPDQYNQCKLVKVLAQRLEQQFGHEVGTSKGYLSGDPVP